MKSAHSFQQILARKKIQLNVFKFVLATAFILPAPFCLEAQHLQRRHVWTDYYNYHVLGPRWNYEWNVALRFLLNGDRYSRYNLRNSLAYRMNDCISVYQGLNFHSMDDHFKANSFEFRSWQAVRLRFIAFKTLPVDNRFTFEERFFRFAQDEGLIYMKRFRYEVASSIALGRRSDTESYCYLPLSEEVLLNLGKDRSRQAHINRISIGLGCRLNRSVRAEAVFVKQHTKTNDERGFRPTDQLYRLKLRYNWN